MAKSSSGQATDEFNYCVTVYILLRVVLSNMYHVRSKMEYLVGGFVSPLIHFFFWFKKEIMDHDVLILPIWALYRHQYCFLY